MNNNPFGKHQKLFYITDISLGPITFQELALFNLYLHSERLSIYVIAFSIEILNIILPSYSQR